MGNATRERDQVSGTGRACAVVYAANASAATEGTCTNLLQAQQNMVRSAGTALHYAECYRGRVEVSAPHGQ